MDRMKDSGSLDWGSIPHGRTNFFESMSKRLFFLLFFMMATCCCVLHAESGSTDSAIVDANEEIMAVNEALASASGDSIAVRKDYDYYSDATTRFNAKQLIAPAVLLGVGVLGFSSDWFKNSINNDVQNMFSRIRGDRKPWKGDDYLQYLPLAGYLTIGFIPQAKAKHAFKERLVVGATAFVAMTAITQGAKYAFRERRPDSDARNSFPSGHTATAFLGAELTRIEYGTGCAIGSYLVATGIGVMRLYNNRHWFNDVIAGAGIGILSAHIGYWMLPLYRKWFHWDPNKQNGAAMAATPFYEPENKAFGFSLAVVM